MSILGAHPAASPLGQFEASPLGARAGVPDLFYSMHHVTPKDYRIYLQSSGDTYLVGSATDAPNVIVGRVGITEDRREFYSVGAYTIGGQRRIYRRSFRGTVLTEGQVANDSINGVSCRGGRVCVDSSSLTTTLALVFDRDLNLLHTLSNASNAQCWAVLGSDLSVYAFVGSEFRKYDDEGSLVTQGATGMTPTDLAIDADDNLYACAFSVPSSGPLGLNKRVASFTSAGAVRWQYATGAACRGIAVSGDGRVAVSAAVVGTIVLTTAGAYVTSVLGTDDAVFDANGNLYTTQENAAGRGPIHRKYDTGYSLAWTKEHNDWGTGFNQARCSAGPLPLG